MALKLVTGPANDPVTRVEAKAHLRVDFTDDDTMIDAFIKAATDNVDGPQGFLGRALIQQTWDLYLDTFPHHHWGYYTGRYPHRQQGCIEIPLPPLIDVGGVYYLDANGDEQELDAATYTVDTVSEPGRVVLKSGSCWPTLQPAANSVRVRFTAGYVTSDSPPDDNVPFAIKAAILMHIGDLYNNRESMRVTDGRGLAALLPWAAEQLLRPYRFYNSMA